MKTVYTADEEAYKVLEEVLKTLAREEAPLAAGRRRDLAVRLIFVQDTLLANATQVVEPADRSAWLAEDRRLGDDRRGKKKVTDSVVEPEKPFHIFGRKFPTKQEGA